MSKTTIYWLFQILGWLSYSIIQFLVLTYDGQPIDKMLIFGEGLQMAGNIFLTHSFRFIIIRFRWLNFSLIGIIPKVLVAIAVMSLFASVLWLLIVLVQSGNSLSELPAENVAQAVIVGLVESLFIFSFWSFAYFIYLYVERYNKSLKYQATTREIELKNLKEQLNPHFIFNALNSIRALVDENPKKAKDSITQLSHILRNSLNSDRKKLVPFAEEMKIVTDYLALESIRYEERLQVQLENSAKATTFNVPPLMIQTLVENGVKHGIAKHTKGGKISISSSVQNDKLLISIRNTGQLDINGSNTGLGIYNTRKRLEMIYGDRASFNIVNENETTVLTQINIPNEDTNN